MVTYHQQTEKNDQIQEDQNTNFKTELKKYFLDVIDNQKKKSVQRINLNYILYTNFYVICLLSQLFDWFVKYFKRKINEKKILSLVVVYLLFSIESISADIQNTTILNKTLNCEKILRKKLFYDENLFKELKMNETLINLYRSCYKDIFHEYKSSHFFVPKPGHKECFIDQIEPNHILYELIYNREKNLIPQKILDRIDLVCNNNHLNDLDRAFYLIGYKHSVCGNIFKNSLKNSHLKEYVFRENNKKKQSNKVRSVSSRHHHNKHHDFPRVISLNSYSINNNSNQAKNYELNEQQFIASDSPNTHLNNCSLILLNIYLLSHTASCSFEDFVESLSHFDCLSNYFSVKSNCNKCQVS